MGDSHDVYHDFRHVHLVDDSVIPESNAVGVLPPSQTSRAQGDWVFAEAIDGRLCQVANLGRKLPELLGDGRVKKDPIRRLGPLPT